MKRRSKLSLKMSFVKKTIDVSVAEGERVELLCGLDGHLDEIVRQRDRELKAVVEQRSRGDVYGAVERLHQQGRVYDPRFHTSASFGGCARGARRDSAGGRINRPRLVGGCTRRPRSIRGVPPRAIPRACGNRRRGNHRQSAATLPPSEARSPHLDARGVSADRDAGARRNLRVPVSL